MDFLAFLITQCLNALSQAALLFFLGVGLTLIFGIMRIVNFAHGAFFMLGAYVGYSAVAVTGSFWAALIAAPLLVGGFGAAFELGILRQLYRRDHSAFLMVTFGLTLTMGEAIRLLWGVSALEVPAPASLSGIVFILDEPFPIYRLFLIGAGIEELLGGAADEVTRVRRTGEAARLLLPVEMGEAFKVMALGRGLEQPLGGFTLPDLTSSL